MLKRAEAEDIVRTSVIPPVGTYSELEAGLVGGTTCPRQCCGVYGRPRRSHPGPDRRAASSSSGGYTCPRRDHRGFGVGVKPSSRWWKTSTLRRARRRNTSFRPSAAWAIHRCRPTRPNLRPRLARLTGAEPKLLPVQGVTTSREAKLLMQSDPFVRETMDLFGSITLAIVGVGAVEPSELLARSGGTSFRRGSLLISRRRVPSATSRSVSSTKTASGEDALGRARYRHPA